jgi:hypothetical protein
MILAALSLGFFSMAYGIDPPEKMWEREVTGPGKFYDIDIVPGDGFVCGAWAKDYWDSDCVYRLDTLGNVMWWTGLPSAYRQTARDVDLLPDGSFIAVGTCDLTPDEKNSLFILQASSEGDLLWYKTYSDSLTSDIAYDVNRLPSGDYIIAGKGHGQAWILRTDENGDTLWTDVWGIFGNSYAAGIEYNDENDWLVVLAQGASDSLPEWGPHFLFYDLDGNYLFGTSYPEIESWDVKGLCPAGSDGYAFVTEYGYGFPPIISGTDYLGELSWSQPIGGFTNGDAHGIDRAVLDDGCMVTGFAQDSISSRSGGALWPQGARLVRFDGRGNEMWDIIEGGFGYQYYAALQLPQGGYVAVGTCYGDGYLVRYAPETGIEGLVSPGGDILRPVTPNPSSSIFHFRVDLPEAMDVRLEVYDTAGRRVGLLADGLLGAGEQSFSWDASGLSSGCYLVRLSGAGVCETRRCVLLR